MMLTLHRGAEEIGGTCLELSSEDSRILLDCGLPLTTPGKADTGSGDRRSVSDLLADGPPVQGIALSHAHPDHSGRIGETDSSVPVLATRTCFKMAMAASIFANQPRIEKERQQVMKPGTTARIGPFRIIPLPVDHSIAGSCAFLIEAKGKRILYTGDLRFHGRKPGMRRALLEACREQPIDLAITEGTTLSRPSSENTVSEYDLEREGFELVRNRNGLVLAHFSPLNLDRFVSFLRIAKKAGRTFVTDPYGAYVLLLARSEGI